jgi:FkbM family methyltransferase
MNFIPKLFHSLPDFKGKRRLMRLFLPDVISNSKDVLLPVNHDMKFKVPNFIETISFEMLVNGIYEKETSDFIVERLPTNGVFFDIGANIGAIALVVCKLRPDIKATCIEASPGVFEYLRFNKELNKISNATIINKAIGLKEGETVSFFSPKDKFGKGSLSSVFTDVAEQVTTVTLDQLADNGADGKIDFIKIDVEGYEYHAFKGGERILTQHDAPDILFEFVDWAEELAKDVKPGDAQVLLKSYGYRIYNFVDGKLIPLKEILTSGSLMLFASKKGISSNGY